MGEEDGRKACEKAQDLMPEEDGRKAREEAAQDVIFGLESVFVDEPAEEADADAPSPEPAEN